MSPPKFSVVIPAYNQANYLSEAIQSVLDQTYGNFELIVVDDASPDETAQVVRQFVDDRIKYLVHEQNRGLPATRNTGIRASTGELIALLDADDFYHPDKLKSHLNFYQEHSDIGATYNNRFELNYSAKTIRNLYRAPYKVGLQDFVLGFPFAPSDMVIRRVWVFKVNLFNEQYRNGAEDIDFPSQLALGGCKFGRVDKALNYRRYHSGKVWKNIRLRIEDGHQALENIFTDVRCPSHVVMLKNMALKNHYEIHSYQAFAQGETELGQELLRESVRLVPSIVNSDPCSYVKLLTQVSSADENQNHEAVLRNIFAQFPEELRHLSNQINWAFARGYLIKGVRAVIWDRMKDGQNYFAQAIGKLAKIDSAFLNQTAHQLQNYANEFDYPSADKVLESLYPFIEQVGSRSCLRYLKGCYFVNKAFDLYRCGDTINARKAIRQAVLHHPGYLANRGVGSILFRTIMSR